MKNRKSKSHKISDWAWSKIETEAKKTIRSKIDTLDIIIKEWLELQK